MSGLWGLVSCGAGFAAKTTGQIPLSFMSLRVSSNWSKAFGRVRIDREGVYGVDDDTSVSDGVPDGLISEIKIRTSDDIWSGYLLRKISDHFDEYVSYGSPLLFQKRNVHNLWDDLDQHINNFFEKVKLQDLVKQSLN